MYVDHSPNDTRDHGPMHYAHLEHDEPLFHKIYSSPDCVNRIKVDINSWQHTEPVWK